MVGQSIHQFYTTSQQFQVVVFYNRSRSSLLGLNWYFIVGSLVCMCYLLSFNRLGEESSLINWFSRQPIIENQ